MNAGPPVKSRDADLERIRNDIRRLKANLEQVRSRTRSAEEELEATELEYAIRTRELQIAENTRAGLEEDLLSVTAEVEAIQQRITRERAFLSARLSMLYRMGGVAYLRVLLDMERRQSPFDAISMLSFLVRRDARSINDLKQATRDLAVRRSVLTTKQSMLAEVRIVIEQRRKEVAASLDQKERLLAGLRSESSSSARRLADLEEKERRLGRLFDLLYQRSNQADGAAADIRGFQGALQWPVRGRVVEEFGRKRSAKFSTFTVSNGLTIRTATGSEIKPVFNGTVLYAQWFKGYGNLVIVDHGNRVFTLYGNTKSTSLTVGQKVMPTAALGTVGESEEGGAGSLYFEVREDNKPTDPRKWLR
ncbi:MAG TPA: peptidoglycan DD-metalloendopeptidase family protein [Thermoanaerobaculia bacterium]|nr:peptidoglycan DD-metalloendopeptidase family protein [Thermoanaerobaculia bacterium]